MAELISQDQIADLKVLKALYKRQAFAAPRQL
jgi:hypothetical protein